MGTPSVTSKYRIEYHLLDDFGEVIRIVKTKWEAIGWYNNGGLYDRKKVPVPVVDHSDLPDAPF